MSDHIRSFVSGNEVFGSLATEAELIALVEKVPAEWVIRTCSLFERLTHRQGARSIENQRESAELLLLGDLRDKTVATVNEGLVFIHEEQLLAVMRLAIEHGATETRTPSEGDFDALGRLLIGANDLLTREGPPEGAGVEEYTAFGFRSLSFQSGQIFAYLIGRAFSYWLRIPPTLRDHSNKWHDVRALFREAAGAPLESVFTAAICAFAYTEQINQGSDESRWNRWLFNPDKLLTAPQDPAGLAEAWNHLSATREQLRADFANSSGDWKRSRGDEPEPRYAGVAMMPLRRRPMFCFADGSAVIVSSRFLLEGLVQGTFWSIADYLGKQSRSARDAFTAFAGEIHQQHVFELMSSAYDLPGVRRVLGDRDAKNTDVVNTPHSADALAFLADHSVFAEATITGFRFGQTVLPADLVEFDADFIRSARAKALQLEDAISDYRVARMRYDPYSDAKSLGQTIWPIVVLRDPLPMFELLRRRVDVLLKEGGVGKTSPPVALIDVEELELALRRDDDGRLRRLLSEWRNDPLYSHENFRNFYLERHATEREPVPYLEECVDAAFDLVRSQAGHPVERKRTEATP